MYQAVIFSFKVSQNFIVYENAEYRNLRAFFNRVKNLSSCNILPNSIVTGMPYLPAKDEVVSLNRRSSRGLWKWYNSKVLDRRLYGVGQHFTFCRFSQKRKFLETLILIFENVSPRGFSDWIWRISKLPFWRQILDIYRQPLR